MFVQLFFGIHSSFKMKVISSNEGHPFLLLLTFFKLFILSPFDTPEHPN